MDIIKKFGDMVGERSIRDPEKARKLLLTGYRLQEKRLQLFPDRKLPASGQYVARVVMQNIIKALAKPDDTALVSIFVPGELLTAAGITPYSVEAMSASSLEPDASRHFWHRRNQRAFRKPCAPITEFFWERP